MAATDFEFPPSFFKVFVSHACSDSMMVPMSPNDQFAARFPKKVILQGPGGGSWNVATKIRGDEVHFAEGWAKFVEDNTLRDGEFLTFEYIGDCIFEVSIFRSDGCKDTYEEVIEVKEEKEDDICSLSSGSDDDTDTILKGKSQLETVEDSDESSEEKETDTDSDSDFTIAKTIPKRMNKGKQKVAAVVELSSDEDGDGDSEYNEEFGQLDLEEKSNSEDRSYAPDNEDTAISVEAEVLILKRKVEPTLKNPVAYLDDPKNAYFETKVKNRPYELLIPAQLVKDYSMKFGDHIDYIDGFGKLRALIPPWKDQRVCVKRWKLICERNQLKPEDCVLCELLRRGSLVYAIKLHVIR